MPFGPLRISPHLLRLEGKSDGAVGPAGGGCGHDRAGGAGGALLSTLAGALSKKYIERWWLVYAVYMIETICSTL